MAENGTNTITALKSATGISDDRLSAHHPNGPGVETKFGFFWINGFDDTELDDRDAGSPRVGEQFSLYMRPPSGFTQITDVNDGDAFVIENSLANGPALTINTDSLSSFNSLNYDVDVGDSELGIELIFDADGQGNAGIQANWDDGINDDQAGTQVNISQSVNIAPEQLAITANIRTDGNNNQNPVEYTISGGNANYDIIIFRRTDSGGNCGNGTYTSVHTDTHTSKGTFTWTDTGLSSSTYYQYKVEVTSADGQGASDETSCRQPA